MAAPFKVTVYSDNVCPWCFVGKRNFEQALKQESIPKESVPVSWKPFFLNIDSPPDGEPIKELLLKKYGQQAGSQMIASLKEAGARTGISFTDDRVGHNTLLSHRLVHLAAQQGRQDAVIEGIFSRYFERGERLSDVDLLVDIAEKAGVVGAREYLEGDAGADDVLKEFRSGVQQYQISGVPFFVIEGAERSVALSGAQPPESFVRAFAKVQAS